MKGSTAACQNNVHLHCALLLQLSTEDLEEQVEAFAQELSEVESDQQSPEALSTVALFFATTAALVDGSDDAIPSMVRQIFRVSFHDITLLCRNKDCYQKSKLKAPCDVKYVVLSFYQVVNGLVQTLNSLQQWEPMILAGSNDTSM